MKIFERIKDYKKEYVYDIYIRICSKIKEYDNISKNKMIREIYKVYEDYYNIIDLCTVRELKFLKLYFDNNLEYNSDKYKWEKKSLREKFILELEYPDDIIIYEEIYDNLKLAINNINWKEAKEKDRLNEFLVSYCKIQGNTLLLPLINIGSAILNVKEEKIYNHIINNKLFNYYVGVHTKEFYNKEVHEVYYISYYSILEDLDEQRSIYGKSAIGNIDLREYKSLFYNDFNMTNKTIKKFYDELIKLPIIHYSVIEEIQIYVLLNLDRKDLKNAIKSIPILKDYDLKKFFKLMDLAMDEMQSGALNGLSINELRELELKEKKIKEEMKYVEQEDAHLSKKDANLFYKLYFRLLQYTNNKYKIKPKYNIIKQKKINPSDLTDIVNKFWKYKDILIEEFCKNNPYLLTKEELDIIYEFKKGIRDNFIIVTFTKEYTAIMNMNKVYMIKGITSNIDETISFESLPTFVETSILPFKDYLIYDGLFFSYPFNFGTEFRNTVYGEYSRAIKYYHL